MKITNFITITLFSISCALAIVSCKKDKKEEEDTHSHPLTANINIISPAEASTIEHEAVVTLNATVSAGFDMHGYEAYLINVTANDTVWEADLHEHATNYTIAGTWINNVTEHSEMKFKIIATLDHDGNTSVKEVNFHCHP